MLKLFFTDASVSLAVLSAGGRATQPCDGVLGDSLRTSPEQEQLFEDVGSWKPRLTVAYLPDWTPEVSELARELVLRHREEGRDVLLRYPINTTMPVPPRHFEVRLHLVYGSLDGRVTDAPSRTPRFWWAATTNTLADRLSECVQQGASVSQALISFLHLDGQSGDNMKIPSCVHVADHSSVPTLTPMGISFDDTKLDPGDRKALTPGIKTALRRLHVNLGHPTNDDLTRCLAAGGGARVAQRAVKSMRCSTCERMSRPRSHRPSRIPTDGERFNERLFVDLCDLVDVRGYWWLVAVDQHTDYTVIAPCPSHKSQAVAKKIFKQWTRWAGPWDVLVCDGSLRDFYRKTLGVRNSGAKQQLHILRGRRVESSEGLPPSRKLGARRFCNTN